MTETKDRHGCLTAWLVLMIIANALTALSYVVRILPRTIHSTRSHTPAWALFLLAAGCIANVVFAVALFRWKRWGFFGALITTVLAFALNLKLGIKPAFAMIGFCGIIILYAVYKWEVTERGGINWRDNPAKVILSAIACLRQVADPGDNLLRVDHGPHIQRRKAEPSP